MGIMKVKSLGMSKAKVSSAGKSKTFIDLTITAVSASGETEAFHLRLDQSLAVLLRDALSNAGLESSLVLKQTIDKSKRH